MNTAAIAIRPAAAVDRGPISATMAAAFSAGPLADWVMPDPFLRRTAYTALCRHVFDYALTHGTVDLADAYLGAAVWYRHPDPAPAASTDRGGKGSGDISELAAIAGADVAYRLAVLDTIMAEHTPLGHFAHLAYLGVYPTMQRRGLGSLLLRHGHHRLDRAGLAAFLVATSSGSRDLYARHGYAVTAQLDLPDGPPLWAMWRPPQR